jgi:hypothetical protein
LNVPFNQHSISVILGASSASVNFRVASFLGDNGLWYLMTSTGTGGLVYLSAGVAQVNYASVFNYFHFRPMANIIYVSMINQNAGTFVLPAANIVSVVFYGCFNGALLSSDVIGRYDEFRLWSRDLSPSECSAMYSNRQYSPPIFRNNLELEYDMNRCELLDFSLAQDGSDLRPAMRDTSGKNRHAYLFTAGTSYPAGTNQFKVDYFNANFIQSGYLY